MSQIDSRESPEYTFSKHVLYRAEAEAKYRRQQKILENKLKAKERRRDESLRKHIRCGYDGDVREYVFALSKISHEPIKAPKSDRNFSILYHYYKERNHTPWGLFSSERGFLIKYAFEGIDHWFCYINEIENSIHITESGLAFISECYAYLDKANKQLVTRIEESEKLYGGGERLYKQLNLLSVIPFKACDITYHIRSIYQVFQVHGKMPPSVEKQIDGGDVYALFRAINYGFAKIDNEDNSIKITTFGRRFLVCLEESEQVIEGNNLQEPDNGYRRTSR